MSNRAAHQESLTERLLAKMPDAGPEHSKNLGDLLQDGWKEISNFFGSSQQPQSPETQQILGGFALTDGHDSSEAAHSQLSEHTSLGYTARRTLGTSMRFGSYGAHPVQNFQSHAGTGTCGRPLPAPQPNYYERQPAAQPYPRQTGLSDAAHNMLTVSRGWQSNAGSSGGFGGWHQRY